VGFQRSSNSLFTHPTWTASTMAQLPIRIVSAIAGRANQSAFGSENSETERLEGTRDAVPEMDEEKACASR